ncbi:MAG: PAS-domain containing protein [Xanthobacteraceae bacterium]
MSGSVLWPVLAAACCIVVLCWALRVRQQNLQITAAVNNMSQGLCMFDSAARLVFANKRYLEIYRLSAETTKPGCTLHDLVKNRQAAGTFSGDVDKYVSNLLNEIATGKAVDKLIELKDGRVIALCNRLMRGGGWVVTHDDITAQRSAEQKHAELAGQEQRRVQVEAAISAFRQRIEAVLGTLAGSAGAIRSTATTLSSASDQTSQRAEGAVKTSNDASGNVEAAADAADELLRSITEIARQLEQTTGLVRVAVTEAQTTNDEIAGLAHAAQKIGDVVKLIQDIAGQTNLLALNATIEAARAGELGRGFAVVASEVKDLARETAAATQRVSDQIAGIQASSDQVTAGIHATSEVIGQLDAVQARITDVLEEQVRMARSIETAE